MKQLNIFDDLPLPKSNTQEVLFILIQQGHVSIMDLPHLSGFRTRVSELKNKYALRFSTKMITKRNKFNNPYTYANHVLRNSNRKAAIKLYKNLVSNSC